MVSIPEVSLGSSCRSIPLIGLGTGAYPPVPSETTKSAVLHAIELGHRHFDTAAFYGSEQPLGEAIVEALTRGLIKSRDELFITSKLWCSDAHHDRVLPAIQNTLHNLQLDYLDLYLIHWPVSAKPGKHEFPIDKEELLPMDMKAVWEAMEQCQKLGLAKAIGVSNFSCKKIELLLAISKIPPVVNQVELNPFWQQKKLREFCATKDIHVTAYSPLGGWGKAQPMEGDVLKEIAEAKGKTIAQVILRWVHEQGVSLLSKSFNEKRMKENVDILDWELNDEDRYKISQIPQRKGFPGEEFTSKNGQYKSVADLWDGEI